MKPNSKKIEALITELLVEIGEDPQREGLVKTPQRVAQAIEFLTSGNRVDAQKLINGAVFTQDDQQHGHRQEHRGLQPVRAPHAAVLRPLPHRLHPQRHACSA